MQEPGDLGHRSGPVTLFTVLAESLTLFVLRIKGGAQQCSPGHGRYLQRSHTDSLKPGIDCTAFGGPIYLSCAPYERHAV